MATVDTKVDKVQQYLVLVGVGKNTKSVLGLSAVVPCAQGTTALRPRTLLVFFPTPTRTKYCWTLSTFVSTVATKAPSARIPGIAYLERTQYLASR